MEANILTNLVWLEGVYYVQHLHDERMIMQEQEGPTIFPKL